MKPSIEYNHLNRKTLQLNYKQNKLLKHAVKTKKIQHYLLWYSPIYHLNQLCIITGRSRAIWECFGLSRQSIRFLITKGQLNGFKPYIY